MSLSLEHEKAFSARRADAMAGCCAGLVLTPPHTMLKVEVGIEKP